ncbi:hypothetical protein GCM10011518_44070 [Flavobacterium limi]|uniref:Antitoxin component YwqK of the YwqJK toxin-antitoxin module n=1 Tax=Flavobacterium limi TaxID=2045105 RepID=A0ABQ1V0H8_9FLAO|nr:hypothetical protein GCM10011518_44070 [Flavobacterium limi]
MSAQKLSLIDLHSIASHKNWETSNKVLLSKGWDYYDSTESDGEGYNKISWALGRNIYDDAKAKAWFYIYNYEGMPNKIMYRFRQKDVYSNISKQLNLNGYKLANEQILDNRVVASYENKNFYLEIAYTREEDSSDNDNYYENANKKTYTVYEVTIYKKGGVYDPNNGIKKDYDENGNLTSLYNLKDGKLDGLYTIYDSIGRVNKTFRFKLGNKEGLYTESIYLEGDTEYYHLEGSYLNDEKEGKWIGKIITPTEKNIVQEFFYINGKKEGMQKEAKQNQIFFQNYKNDVLEGISYEYNNISRQLLGGYSCIDTLKIKVYKNSETTYRSNKLNGLAKYFDITGSLIAEGVYQDSLKTGLWKYYHESIVDENNVLIDCSKKLCKESNYVAGKLNGTQKLFSVLDEISIPCKDDKSVEGCTKTVCLSINEIANYKDDELDGSYELKDANGNLISRGNYSSGKRIGKWDIHNQSKFSLWLGKSTYETGFYTNNQKEGKWQRFDADNELLESYTYSHDSITGEHVTYSSKRVKEKKYFNNGELLKIEELDTAGNIKKSYSFKNESANKFDCVFEETLAEGVFSSTYSFIKTGKFVISPITFQLDFLAADTSVKKLNGLFEHRSLDNQTLEIGDYTSGTKTGNWEEYYYDQNIRASYDYDGYGVIVKEYYYDLKQQIPYSGEFAFKNKDGLFEERKIKDGVRNGTTRYKDSNDKTIKKETYKQGVLKE